MRVCALLLLTGLLAAFARAEPAAGDAAPPVLAIAGKQVPLPAGTWVIGGRAAGTISQGGDLGSYGAIRNLVLLRLAVSGGVDAVAEVNVNDMAVTDGWGIAADCQRGDLKLTAARSRAGWDAACFFLADASLRDAPEPPVAWRQAERTAALRGLTLPATASMAGFRVANRRDVIDVRVYFRRGSVDDRDLAAWAAMMIGCVEAGLKNRLSASLAVPAPGTGEVGLEHASLSHRKQAQLDDLLAAGVLSADEHVRQSVLLLQAEADDTAADPAADRFYRLLSYQGLSVTSDALVTFAWTAQSVQAAALTVVQAGLRAGRLYVVGHLWDAYGTTPTRPDVARVVDFAYGGTAVTAAVSRR